MDINTKEEHTNEFKQHYWEVCIYRIDEVVVICPTIGLAGFKEYKDYIRSPNFIERLFGYTFASKIAKSKEKCQKWCDKKNIEIDIARRASGEIQNG